MTLAGNLFLLSVSYLVGMSVLYQIMLIFGMTGIRFSFASIGTVMLVLSCSLLFFVRKRENDERLNFQICTPKSSQRCSQGLFLLVFSLVVFNIFWVFFIGFLSPICGWDTLATIIFKAKIFFYERSLHYLENLPHPRYPLQIPFSVCWYAMAGGQWDDQAYALLNLLCYFVSFLSGIFIFLRYQGMNYCQALLGLALLLSSNFLLAHLIGFYSDFPLACYNMFVFLSLFLWYREKNLGWLVLAAFLSGASGCVKLEGMIYSGIHLASLFFILLRHPNRSRSFRECFKYAALFLGIVFAMTGPFFLYKLIALGSADLSGGTFNLSSLKLCIPTFVKVFFILRAIFLNLFLSGNWNIIWFLFILSIVPVSRKSQPLEVLTLLFSLGLFFMIVILGFSTSQFYHDAAFGFDPLSRIILHFFPLVPLCIIMVDYQID